MVHILNGLATSMLLFLVASGLNIIFGILGVINFAHGTLFLLGAYVTLTVINLGGNFWWARNRRFSGIRNEKYQKNSRNGKRI